MSQDAAANGSRRTSQDFCCCMDPEDTVLPPVKIDIHWITPPFEIWRRVLTTSVGETRLGTRPDKPAQYRLDRYLGGARTVVEEPLPLLPAHAAKESDI
jgi:hypothetical protein